MIITIVIKIPNPPSPPTNMNMTSGNGMMMMLISIKISVMIFKWLHLVLVLLLLLQNNIDFFTSFSSKRGIQTGAITPNPKKPLYLLLMMILCVFTSSATTSFVSFFLVILSTTLTITEMRITTLLDLDQQLQNHNFTASSTQTSCTASPSFVETHNTLTRERDSYDFNHFCVAERKLNWKYLQYSHNLS